MLGRIKIGFGGETALHQRPLPFERGLRECDILAGGRYVDAASRGGGPQSLNLHFRSRNRGIGLRQRNFIGSRINPEQDFAFLDHVIGTDIDLDYPAADFGSHRNPVLLDIGIVGRHALSAGQPEISANRDQDQRHNCHDGPATPATLGFVGRIAIGHRPVLILFGQGA